MRSFVIVFFSRTFYLALFISDFLSRTFYLGFFISDFLFRACLTLFYFSLGANATLINLNPHWLIDPETGKQFRDF